MFLKNQIKKIWYGIFDQPPSRVLGYLVRPFIPKKILESYAENIFTSKPGFLSEIIIWAASIEFEKADRNLASQSLWSSKTGKLWHDRQSLRETSQNFESTRASFVDSIDSIISQRNFDRLVEIGTGRGLFLDFLFRRYTTIPEFIGVDLNEALISENEKKYGHLKFIAADAVRCLDLFQEGKTLLVVFDTIKYLSPAELELFFETISRNPNILLVMMEPIRMRLDSEFQAKPLGVVSLSHNYPKVMEKVGLKVLSLQKEKIDPILNSSCQLAITAESKNL